MAPQKPHATPEIPTRSPVRLWAGVIAVVVAVVAVGAILADLTFDSKDDALDNQSMPAAG